MDRVERLRKLLAEQGLNALCVRDTSNIAYLTGFDRVFDEERAHALLVTADEIVLHTDSRYAHACRKAATAGGEQVRIDDAPDKTGRAKTHARWIAEQAKLGVLGIEDTITLFEFRKLEEELNKAGKELVLIETSGAVLGLRSTKDANEIKRLQAAQAITDAAFTHIVGYMQPGMTERQVQIELDSFMRKQGADDLAFSSIVATGPNGANPHAQPGSAVLEQGHCVVMDFGAKLNGYCSDMTRMVFVGEPPQQMRDAYEVLRQANEQVQATLRPGITGQQAHNLALSILEKGGFGGKMGHGLGHGVGLDVHEDPVLAPRNVRPLEAGNVVTVEPGIYLPGNFGMRLEDCGVITHEGFCSFAQSTHDLVII